MIFLKYLLLLSIHLICFAVDVLQMLNAAQVSREEYDSMVDLFLPFGRSIQTPMPT